MSEAEVIELSLAMGANMTNIFTVFVSVTFAYMTLCYFVGGNLTRFQAAAISILYIVGASSFSVSIYGYLEAQIKLQAKYPGLMNTIPAINAELWIVWQPMLAVIIVIMSLVFMLQTRRAGT